MLGPGIAPVRPDPYRRPHLRVRRPAAPSRPRHRGRGLGSATGPVQQWLLDTLGKSRKLKAANGKVRYNAWPFPRALGNDGATCGESLTVTDAKRLVKWDAPEGIEEMVDKINQATTTSTDTGTASRSG